jgi:hypothetical protein
MMQLVECVHVTSSNNRQGRKQWDCGTAWVGTEGMVVPTQMSYSMSLCAAIIVLYTCQQSVRISCLLFCYILDNSNRI